MQLHCQGYSHETMKYEFCTPELSHQDILYNRSSILIGYSTSFLWQYGQIQASWLRQRSLYHEVLWDSKIWFCGHGVLFCFLAEKKPIKTLHEYETHTQKLYGDKSRWSWGYSNLKQNSNRKYKSRQFFLETFFSPTQKDGIYNHGL